MVRERHRRDDGRPGDYDADCRARGAGEPVALAVSRRAGFSLIDGRRRPVSTAINQHRALSVPGALRRDALSGPEAGGFARRWRIFRERGPSDCAGACRMAVRSIDPRSARIAHHRTGDRGSRGRRHPYRSDDLRHRIRRSLHPGRVVFGLLPALCSERESRSSSRRLRSGSRSAEGVKGPKR